MKEISTVISMVKSIKEISSENLAIFVPQEWEKIPNLGSLNDIITKLISDKDFDPKLGNYFVVPSYLLPRRYNLRKVVLVGVGDQKKVDFETIRRAGAVLASINSKLKLNSIGILNWFLVRSDKNYAFKSLLEGIFLGAYHFSEFFSSKEDKEIPPFDKVEVILPRTSFTLDENVINESKIVCESVYLARDLQNLPSNIATPSYIASVAVEEGRKCGIQVKVIEKEEAEKMGMGLFLAVARGSDEPAKFVVMEYKGGGDKWYGFVGKGITFDTGGISIKPSEKMEEMKFDMSGAAVVISSIIAIARLGLKINVFGIAPLTENMPSGKAVKPGDIVKSMGGITAEIINTDAEGRLILADALEYAKKYKPEFVIDIATLTGACMVALGLEAAGLMGNDESLLKLIKDVSEKVYERTWELPLWDDYDEYIKSDFADVKNVGNRYGGAITAASFLKKFVGYKWAHLDIAGVANTSKDKFYIKKGGTGFGVRLFTEIARTLQQK